MWGVGLLMKIQKYIIFANTVSESKITLLLVLLLQQLLPLLLSCRSNESKQKTWEQNPKSMSHQPVEAKHDHKTWELISLCFLSLHCHGRLARLLKEYKDPSFKLKTKEMCSFFFCLVDPFFLNNKGTWLILI